jgi:hypothetical protein
VFLTAASFSASIQSSALWTLFSAPMPCTHIVLSLFMKSNQEKTFVFLQHLDFHIQEKGVGGLIVLKKDGIEFLGRTIW